MNGKPESQMQITYSKMCFDYKQNATYHILCALKMRPTTLKAAIIFPDPNHS